MRTSLYFNQYISCCFQDRFPHEHPKPTHSLTPILSCLWFLQITHTKKKKNPHHTSAHYLDVHSLRHMGSVDIGHASVIVLGRILFLFPKFWEFWLCVTICHYTSMPSFSKLTNIFILLCTLPVYVHYCILYVLYEICVCSYVCNTIAYHMCRAPFPIQLRTFGRWSGRRIRRSLSWQQVWSRTSVRRVRSTGPTKVTVASMDPWSSSVRNKCESVCCCV